MAATGAEPAARPLIGAAELAALCASADPPALLDVRWRLGGPPGIGAYLAGHLPGACFIDLEADLSGPPGPGGRHPLPGPAAFESAMRRAGLSAGQLAVAYDDADGMVAARLWWLLRYFGHRRAALLDGGYRAWAGAGLPVTRAVRPPGPGDFRAGGGGMPVLDEAGAARMARDGILLDARSAERYRGDFEPVDRAAGHIPGAVSAPAQGNVGPDGRFLPPAELAGRFSALGVPAAAGRADGTPAVGVYCGSGVTAAHEVLALALAGIPAALYVGSWSAWCSDPSRPVATGQEPG